MSAVQWPLIYFIRHGQTDWNKEQRFQGQRDIPLNDLGRDQARSNGKILRKLLAESGVDAKSLDWFCSPLGRTKETMALARAQFEVELPEVIYDDRLKEISFGDMEGVLLTEIESDYPEEFEKRQRSKWDHLPPNGENYDMLVDRLDAFCAEQLTKPAVIVSHGGVARALRHHIGGSDRAELDNWPAPQDKVMVFDRGTFTLHG